MAVLPGRGPLPVPAASFCDDRSLYEEVSIHEVITMFSSTKFPVIGQSGVRGFFASPDTPDVQLRVKKFRPDDDYVPERCRPSNGKNPHGLWSQRDEEKRAEESISFTAKI